MGLIKKGFILAIILILVAQCLTIGGMAVDEARLITITPTAVLQRGDEFEVGVLLENNPGIVIFSIFLHYDDTRFQYISVTKGPAVGNQSLDGADDFFDGEKAVRVTNGLQWVSFTNNGVLYTVKFRVKNDAAFGEANFSLSYRAGDIVGDPIQPGYLPNNLFPDTVAASVVIGQAQHEVTGLVRSYNPQRETDVELYKTGTEVLVASKTIDASSTGFGRVTQGFKLENVPEGVYDLVVSKKAHLSYTIIGLAVGAEDLDLTADPDVNINMISLPCGDINGDGMINDDDLTILWTVGNYNMHKNEAYDTLCDLNGDGMINDGDLTILWMAGNYNKSEIVYRIDTKS